MSAVEVERHMSRKHLSIATALSEAQELCGSADGAINYKKRLHHRRCSHFGQTARRAGGAIDTIATLRASGYRRANLKSYGSKGAAASGIGKINEL